MAKRRLSDRELLIEQCLYDAEFEREGSINEGFVDDIKAKLRGAGEWLKQDAKDSFRLRKKNDIKSNRTNAKISGKVKSYAGSLAKTMKDFRNTGGTLGSNIDGIDDVINRLDQVSKGIAPRGVNTSKRVKQSNAFVTTPQPQQQPQNAQPTNPATSQTPAPAPASTPAPAPAPAPSVKQKTKGNAFISPAPAPAPAAAPASPAPAPAAPAQPSNPNQAVSAVQETPASNSDINSSNNVDTNDNNSNSNSPVEKTQPTKRAKRGPLTRKEKIKWARKLGKKQRKARAAEKRQAEKDKKQPAPEKQTEDVSDNIKPLGQPAPTAKNSSKAKVKKSSGKPRKIVTAKDIQDKERIQQQRQTLDDYNAAIERGESPSLNTSAFREPQRKVLKFNKKVKPTRKIRTVQDIKDAKERKEAQEFLSRHNWENDPEAFMYDSYDPYRNSKGQLQMLNSIK